MEKLMKKLFFHTLSAIVVSFVLFASCQMAAMGSVVPCFKTEAQKILSKGIDRLGIDEVVAIGGQFNQENKRVCTWFDLHVKQLTAFLREQQAASFEVKVMGSHRWNLNHWLSDIDAVLVTNSDPEILINSLARYYTNHYPLVDQLKMKTKAGLYLFVLKAFEDKSLGAIKLEYTAQTPETNHHIIESMQLKLAEKFGSDQLVKTRYALEMMKAVAENDAQRQLELKEWTRVLPAKQ